MQLIDLSKMRAFYMVAREGNVTRAAEKLKVSQPALSEAISSLEENVKTKLFDRLPRGMRLTAEGERLYMHAKKLIEEHEAFEKVFYEKSDEIEGDLKIITTPYLGSEWLIFKLQKFLKQYPKLKIRIIVREDKDISIEEADVAIATPLQHQPYLIQKYLFTVRHRLVASPAYLKEYGVPLTPQDLDHHRLITYAGSHYNPYGSTNWVLNMGKADNEATRKSYIEINSLHGIINAALAGLGIAEVPDFPGVLRPELREIFLNSEGPTGKVNYIFHEKRQNSKKIIELLHYLIERE